mmetsp:Transcript_137694/g.242778  ORF Transcript_137694/g.242778 Transcript_137694/m.242778 type:complete len:686 (+) Transcript_137694:106-2163(+)
MVNEATQQITLSKKQAFALCKDILHGFNSANFQMQLKALMHGRKSVKGHLPGRSELAFTVQSKVLPKHGFPGTEAGVHMMYDAIHPLLDDPSIQQMRVLIEDKLGMNAETSLGRLTSLFRSDALPEAEDSTSLTASHFSLMCQEVVDELSHPEYQALLQKMSADDVRGRITLALVVQSKVLSAHGIQGVESLFSDLLSPQAAEDKDRYHSALDDVLGLKGKTPVVELLRVSQSLTKDEFMSMTKKLVEGFCTPDFMQALQKLDTDDAAGRKELALTVQKSVLPKYGIPGTPDGVQFMLKAIAPYMNDWMLILEGLGLQHMLLEIENKLKTSDETSLGKLPCLLLNSKPNVMVNEKPNLTKDQVFKMLWELLEGYSTPDFQEQLQTLIRKKSNLVSVRALQKSPQYIPGRSKLALTVQKQVLPRYGHTGTFEWEKVMREAISPFQGDWMLQEMLWAIDVQLAKNTETTLEWLLGFLRKHAKSAVQVSLTKVEMLSVTKELLEGFSRCDFQEKVEEFLSKDESAYDMPGRMELALTVQSEVLPKYGIPGTHEGVAIMLEAMLPYTDDEKVQELHELMLGAISPFVHDWAQLMDVLSLEDMIEVIDNKLDEMAEVDETEDSVDKFACLDLKCVDTLPEEFDDGKKISWCRQITGNSEASTACPWDGPDSPTWGRQISEMVFSDDWDVF